MLEASKEMMKMLLAAVFASSALWAGPAEIARAADLYHRTKYEEAFRILQPVLGNDPSAHSLAGKCQYMVGDFKKAIDLFEKAVQLNGQLSDYYHWLGRAYGRRAESGNPLIAPHYATRARQMFEKAVELDRASAENAEHLAIIRAALPG